MPAPIIPWQPSNIPFEIQSELNRRKVNRSFKYVQGQQANWDAATGDWKNYRGPMVSWIRVCSNSAGHPDADQKTFSNQRFVLYGGKGFYQTYGFAPPNTTSQGSKYQVIGYTPGDYANNDFGHPHIIENSLIQPANEPVNYPINVPPPEISRLEVTVQKELFRRVQIEWVCFSWKQLVYMTPYFLVPGITCMVEWGWNHYNVQSLVNLGSTKTMRELWDNAYPLYINNILMSNGNYDVVYGIITNFNWSIEGNKIICTTEITSKDRLYSGIAKDYGLTVTDSAEEKGGIFKSLRDFLKDDQTIKNLRTLVTQTPVVNQQTVSLITSDPKQQIWYDILNPLLTQDPKNNIGPEQVGMRMPWVFGFFAGRPDDAYTAKENFGTPKVNDFDKKVQDNDTANIWINMGMVTTLLNYFSALPSGAKDGKSMFEVDIQNCVIGAHPNMVSCDPRVLIPNYQAPKFLFGDVGTVDNVGASLPDPDPEYPYTYQVTKKIDVGTVIANQTLSKTFFQDIGKDKVCYRDDLDSIINYNRYRYAKIADPSALSPLNSYSFPSKFDSDKPLPISPRGLRGDKIDKNFSGLLSNIYISFSLLKEAVDDESNASFPDIYRHIFTVLMNASDGFWELVLADADGVITVSDKKYISKYALDAQQDVVYSFDYYDADSIIKALKFRPVLSDAQATRTIYGEVNNKDSRFKYLDKNDVLDYKFRDAVIGTPEDKSQGDPNGPVDKRKTANEQLRDLVRVVQNINSQSDDGTLQMSLNPSRQGSTAPAGTPRDMPEIVKLVMPSQQLLRILLNDEDEESNGRYCAVQPGIILELTLQGIGGLRTFQYFLVRNLPEPYSDRNIIFRITDVHQTLEAGNWETTIRAQPLPLRAYIKKRLQGPYKIYPGGWPPDPTSK